MSLCTAHNGSGQDIHDHDLANGRPCCLCQSTLPIMTDAEIMAEEARIARAEAR